MEVTVKGSEKAVTISYANPDLLKSLETGIHLVQRAQNMLGLHLDALARFVVVVSLRPYP